MASTPVNTGASSRAPAIDRRQLLGNLAAMPLAGALAVSSASRWEAAEASYLAALAVENSFYAHHVHPMVPDSLPVGYQRNAAVGAIPAWVWDEAQQLGERRSDAEDVLMAIASPHAAAFARKCLVAFGDGRETDCWNDMLQAEARFFAGAH